MVSVLLYGANDEPGKKEAGGCHHHDKHKGKSTSTDASSDRQAFSIAQPLKDPKDYDGYSDRE